MHPGGHQKPYLEALFCFNGLKTTNYHFSKELNEFSRPPERFSETALYRNLRQNGIRDGSV